MKATGIIRRMDELGRIVVPKEVRTAIDFSVGTNVEISTEGKDILLKKGNGLNAQVRKVDSLGRIVIPMSIRKILNINKDDRVEVFIENEDLIFRKYNVNCIVCGSYDDIVEYKDKKICCSCVKGIKVMI